MGFAQCKGRPGHDAQDCTVMIETERTKKLFNDLTHEVLRAFDDFCDTDDKKRIRSVARSLCACDGGLELIDHITMGIPGAEPMRVGKGIAFVYPLQPAWAAYWTDAEIAIEAVDKANE